MMRTAGIVALVLLAVVSLAGPVVAKDTTGKILAIEGEKVVLQLGNGDGANFPVGTRGIDLTAIDGATVRARVVAASGDKITFRVMKGKASSLNVGASVTLERAKKAGSEEMQGC